MSDIKPEGIEKFKEEDWRGILAVGFTAVFGAISAIALLLGGVPALQTVAAVFGPMEGLILGFYFGQKSKG